MIKSAQTDKDWETFNKNKAKTNYPKWPNEAMVKVAFGNYLNSKIIINPGLKVLDVGCGFGNNLIPFIDAGCECYGTEVTSEMAAQTQEILEQRGFKADIRFGKNDELPFDDSFFDLLLSINVLHYAQTEDRVGAALREYSRVLTKNGRFILITVGPDHIIIKKAKVIGPNQYRIQNYDFRDGTCFYCFNRIEYMDYFLSQFFADVEVGRLTEQLMTLNLDFFIGTGKSKK